MILDTLFVFDETFEGSLALLNLASSSHLHWYLIDYWATPELSGYFEYCRENHSTHTRLAMLCKGMSGICTICNNRALYPCVWTERFTSIRLCEGCESIYFPKISHKRLLTIFRPTPRLIQDSKSYMPRGIRIKLNMEKYKFQEQFHGPFYPWGKIQELVTNGLFEEIPQTHLTYNGEEYGVFVPENQVNHDETYWPRQRLWLQCCVNGGRHSDDRNKLPHITEALLFREFRYRFDPTWRPEESLNKHLRDYLHVARHWAKSAYWTERPWRISNYPKSPRSSFLTTTLEERINDPTFKSWQFHSAKLRALLKAFPDILRSPRTWCRCMTNEMRDSPIKEAVEIALRAKKHWIESILDDFEYEIRSRDGDLDVEFVRRGRNLRFSDRINDDMRVTRDGEIWKIDIIQESTDMFHIRSQTRLGNGDCYFRKLLDE